MGKSPEAPRDPEHGPEGRSGTPVSPETSQPKSPDVKKLSRAERAREKAREDLRCLKRDADMAKQYETIHQKPGFKSGRGELSDVERSVVPYIDPSLEYRATGGVEMGTFDAQKDRPDSEYLERRELAKQFLQLMTDGRLDSNIRTICDTEMLGVMDILARYDGNPVACKKKIDLKGLDRVYGSHGAYNILLALKRANLVIPPGKRNEKTLFNLRISRGRRPENRFTELAQKRGEPVAPVNPLEWRVGMPDPVEKKFEIPKGEEKKYAAALDTYLLSGQELKGKGVKVRRISGKEKIGDVDLSDAEFIVNEKFYVRLDWANKTVILTSYQAATSKEKATEVVEKVYDMGDLKSDAFRQAFAEKVSGYVFFNRLDWK